MASMSAGIILSGRQPDTFATIDRANARGDQYKARQQKNALNTLFRQEGGAIAQGEQGAINRLAQYDPAAAQSFQQNKLGMDAQRQNMSMQQQGMDLRNQELEVARQNAAQKAAEHVANMDQQERAAQAERIEGAVAGGLAAQTPQEWDAFMTERGYSQFVGAFEKREMIAAEYMGVADALKDFRKSPEPGFSVPSGTMLSDPNDPRAGVVPIPGAPETGKKYRVATPSEAAAYGAKAGQINTETNEFKAINLPKGSTISVGADGSIKIVDGPGVGGGDAGGGFDPASIDGMISNIDGILDDPAFNSSTGIFSLLQNVPGTPQYRFGTRVKQLEGKAFLRAFDYLKGAGQISEIEGLKATQAIGRLDSAQSADDYRPALNELKDLLVLAQSRQPNSQNGNAGGSPAASPSQQQNRPMDGPSGPGGGRTQPVASTSGERPARSTGESGAVLGTANPVTLRSSSPAAMQEHFMKLPSGSIYQGPDGIPRRKN